MTAYGVWLNMVERIPFVTGDTELAMTMRRMKVAVPVEVIVETDWLATAVNRETLGKDERVVILACGHYVVTANRKKVPCTKCHEMILNGEDYDLFRNGPLNTPGRKE